MDILNFIINAIKKIVSFGLLPENVPDIGILCMVVDPVTKEFTIEVVSKKHPAIITKISSKDYLPLTHSRKLHLRASEEDSAKITLPMSDNSIKKFTIKMYFHDIQNRRYSVEIHISPSSPGYQLSDIKRAFCK